MYAGDLSEGGLHSCSMEIAVPGRKQKRARGGDLGLGAAGSATPLLTWPEPG
jgi:hypothetical protein